MGHARSLSKLSDDNQINSIADKIIEGGLSVRETERMVSDPEIPKINKTVKHTTYSAKHSIYESLLREKLGSKVRVSTNKIEISFVNDADLERLLEIIGISIEGE